MRLPWIVFSTAILLGCADTLTCDMVVSPDAAATLGSRARVVSHDAEQLRVSVTYHVGEEVPGEGTVKKQASGPVVIGGVVTLCLSGAMMGGAFLLGESGQRANPSFVGFDFDGTALAALFLFGAGFLGALAGVGVIIAGAIPQPTIVPKRTTAARLSVTPLAGRSAGGAMVGLSF
jgi:hypothetical protein